MIGRLKKRSLAAYTIYYMNHIYNQVFLECRLNYLVIDYFPSRHAHSHIYKYGDYKDGQNLSSVQKLPHKACNGIQWYNVKSLVCRIQNRGRRV